MSHTTLTHPFKDTINVADFRVDKNGQPIITIDKFCSHVRWQAGQLAAGLVDSGVSQDAAEGSANKYKGDALEILVEYMMLTMGETSMLSVWDYKPMPSSCDYGIDGYGKGANGKTATVQVKNYIPTPEFMLTDRVLGTFLASSSLGFTIDGETLAVDQDDTKNMLVVTTGLGFHYGFEARYGNKVRCVNRENLKAMLDNQHEWWNRFYDSIHGSQIKRKAATKKKELRRHQRDAVAAADGFTGDRGQIICPTGTGKTLIEAAVVAELLKSNPTAHIQFNSPRISLCFQLANDVANYLTEQGINNFVLLNFNSGKNDEAPIIEMVKQSGGIYNGMKFTTNHRDVVDQLALARSKNAPLIVFSTYHSAENLSDSGEVPDLMLHDEAHNLVNNLFSRVVDIPATQHLFFTATPINTASSDGLGMNNVAKFGPRIFEVSARKMILRGEMVPPHLLAILPAKNAVYDALKVEDDSEAMIRATLFAFEEHERILQEASYNPSLIGGKMLVALKGQDDLFAIQKSKVLRDFLLANPDVHVGGMASDFGVWWDDDWNSGPQTPSKREFALNRLREAGVAERVLFFHVDMIGEGINVPGLTGVMPFREMNEGKLCQLIGRAARLHPFDRERLYNGEIASDDNPYTRNSEPIPEDVNLWVKPFCLIVIPDYFNNSFDWEARIRNVIDTLRRGYDFSFIHHVHESYNGLFVPTLPTPINVQVGASRNLRSGLTTFEGEQCSIADIMSESDAEWLSRKHDETTSTFKRRLAISATEVDADQMLNILIIMDVLARLNNKTWANVTVEDIEPTFSRWDMTAEDVQEMFTSIGLGDLTWPEISAMLNEDMEENSPDRKRLDIYLATYYDVLMRVSKSRDPEEIAMAKATLSGKAHAGLRSRKAQKAHGEVHTPLTLIDEMLNKLPAEVWSNPDLKWLDPAMGTGGFPIRVYDRLMDSLAEWEPDESARRKHILEQMIYGVELQAKNVVITRMILDLEGEYKLNFAAADSLAFDYWGGMKFDVVVGNPPYQAPQVASGKRGGGDQLWDKFVVLALDNLLAKNGYLCFVHPAIWRKPQAALWPKMSGLQMHYLEIHNTKDGQKTFNAGTRYDFYVIENKPYSEKTIVVDEIGACHSLDLREWPWLPNYAFKAIGKIIETKENESRIIFNVSNYETRKSWTSETEDGEFIFPLIHTTAQSGVRYCYSSRDDNGHFGIPKVIFGDSGIYNPIIDLDGKYGMTQHAMALPVTNMDEAEKVTSILSGEIFEEILAATKWSNFQIDWRMFKFFKKDWWKEFVK